MNYRVTHRTLYEYAAPVTVSQHVTRLEPRVTPTQSCDKFSLTVFPEPVLRKTRPDYFGNRLCFFSIQEIHHQPGRGDGRKIAAARNHARLGRGGQPVP